MNRSLIIAAGISAVLVLFFAIGTMSAEDDAEPTDTDLAGKATTTLSKVITETFTAEPHAIVIELKGQTAPDRIVTVKSATMGVVVSTPAEEGKRVSKGDVLCGLDVEARRANVRQAEAQRAAAMIDYEAAKSLAAKGLTPANREASAKAAVDAAEAAVSAAKIELSRTQIRAPFRGIFETRMAEAGDFLSPGGPCGVLVDLSPVLFTAQLTEEQSRWVQPGIDASVSLNSGDVYPAVVRHVARTADPQTRTFAIEAALKTGHARVAAGVTASIRISVDETDAINISPALLTLADDGAVGVRFIDDQDIVRFAEVTIIDSSETGVWVTGLPSEVRLITQGQDFLSEGLKVEPIEAESEPT